MFEKAANNYADKYVTEGVDELKRKVIKGHWQDGAEFGYKKGRSDQLVHKQYQLNQFRKANEWHYVKDGDLPKENQECYFIYSNTYDKLNKVSFAKSNIKVRTGIYSFFLDDEGNQTTEPCFYDDVIGDEIDLSEVYAWKEIVLPELPKESE